MYTNSIPDVSIMDLLARANQQQGGQVIPQQGSTLTLAPMAPLAPPPQKEKKSGGFDISSIMGMMGGGGGGSAMGGMMA